MRPTTATRLDAHRLLLCAVLALAPLPQAAAEEGTNKWLAWQGRESDGWDFTATSPVEGGKDGEVTYTYAARRTTGEGQRRGKLEVFLFGHRLKALLRDEHGKEFRAYDGSLGPEGRVVFGQAWDVGTSGPGAETRVPWWATTETAAIGKTVGPLDVNTASVADLVARGLSPEGARTIVQGRLVTLYENSDEALEAPGLAAADKEALRRKPDADPGHPNPGTGSRTATEIHPAELRVTLDLDGATLADALDLLRSQTKVTIRVAPTAAIGEGEPTYSVKGIEMSLADSLELLLVASGRTWRVEGDAIVIEQAAK